MYQLKSSLEVAVEAAARVDAVLAKKGKIKLNPILVNANKAPTDLFQTEFEINDVPLNARNLLTKGITQEEINYFSGASISTRGRFVNPEDKDKLPKGERPLYLFIQGPNKQSLDLAIQRIDSLIKDMMEQEKFKNGPPPPVITMQTSLPGLEKVIVGLDNAPATFDVRNKVLGPNGANLQYISNETGAVVTLRGRTSGYPEPGTGQESPEPLHICVEHQKMEVLQAARQLAFNLVETIQQEFTQLHPQMSAPTGPPLQLPPQGPGGIGAVTLPPDQLPPGMVQLPVPGQVGGLVNVPPPSLAVPPPQLVQQPPPIQAVNLPPPGVHIPAHQGPLAQAVAHQQIIQQPPPISTSVGLPSHSQALQQVLSQPPPTLTSQAQMGHMVVAGQPPPTSIVTSAPQQSQPQAFITQATYPVQYIQAGGQTLMTVREGAGGGQVLIPQQQQQLIQTSAGLMAGQQQAQLQLIPGPNGTQQLVMQQPQQVTMLLQYQQPGEAGKAGVARLITPQRLATPVQIQLQPGVQLINPQLLQPGQTQVQLQLQQPIAQQLIRGTGQQVQLQQTRLQLQTVEQQQQLQQQVQQQQHQIQQQQLQQQQAQQQQAQQQQQIQQQQLQQQQQIQQQQQQQIQQQQIQQQQQMLQQQQQGQQQQSQQQGHPVTSQMVQQQNQSQQGNQQIMQSPQQNSQLQQTPPQVHQSSQQTVQNPQQQQMNQQQQQPHQPPQQKRDQQQKQNQTQHQQPAGRLPSQHQGQKRKYEGEQSSNNYQGPPQPVPPPKQSVPSPQKQAVPPQGIGNSTSVGQKGAVAGMTQLPPQMKTLMPPPPPPQTGAPDNWQNSSEQMNQQTRGEQPPPPQPQQPQVGDNRANMARPERPTFNHYSSKPQLYNANLPFHVQGLGAYPPPPPPPPPPVSNPGMMAPPGQYPFYQQPPAAPPPSQYPYFMMPHQQ